MDEIEKFLQQAAARRAQNQQQPRQPPRPAAPQPPRPFAPQPPAPIQYVEPEIIEPDIMDGDNVAQHVTQHLDTGGFDQRAAHLGEEVGLADDHLEAHLHEQFDHRIGSLQDTSADAARETADAAASKILKDVPAGQIAALLRSPQSIRQAIILSEVLRRPDERW